MKRLALLCGAMLLFAGMASAQENPKVEVFGGYSYLRVSVQDASFNYNGGSGSGAYNLTPWLGVVSDFGGYHWSGSGDSAGSTADVVTYLFGPKLAYRSGRFTPFAQALFGGAHLSGTASGSCGVAVVHGEAYGGSCCSTARVHAETNGCGFGGSANAFAMALGGGLNWNATPHIGIRLVQAEYLMTQFSDGANNRQNNARVSAGVVFRW